MKFLSLHRLLVLVMLVCATVIPLQHSWAVNPDEVLDDPILEERARDISAELRCLVCQNQSIDDSDAPLARDLRVLVRERLVAGDSNDEAREFLVSRYGEFVLLKPTFTVKNFILWGFGPVILIVGLFVMHRLYRKNKNLARKAEASGAVSLSSEEQEQLKKILQDESEA